MEAILSFTSGSVTNAILKKQKIVTFKINKSFLTKWPQLLLATIPVNSKSNYCVIRSSVQSIGDFTNFDLLIPGKMAIKNTHH